MSRHNGENAGEGSDCTDVKYCVSTASVDDASNATEDERILTCLFPPSIDVNRWRAALRITHGAGVINNLLM